MLQSNAVLASSSERLLKLHSYTGLQRALQMEAEVSYYFDISTNVFSLWLATYWSVLPCSLSTASVNTWLLSAVLMAASRDLYFTVVCQQDTKLTGVQQWLTFSPVTPSSLAQTEAEQTWGWSEFWQPQTPLSRPPHPTLSSRPTPLQKLPTTTHSWRALLVGLALSYSFIKHWVSAAPDVTVFPAGCQIGLN